MADDDAIRPGRGLVSGLLISAPFYLAVGLYLLAI